MTFAVQLRVFGIVTRGPESLSGTGQTHSPVWTPPHLLQLELFHSSFVGSDRRALDADRILLDGLGTVNGNLIIRLYRN